MNECITAIYGSIAKLEPLEAQHFIQHMDDCTQDQLHDANLLGHHELYHMNPLACGSILLYLCHLTPHYPNL